MQTHIITIDNYPSHPIEEQVTGNLNNVFQFLKLHFFSDENFETLEDITESGEVEIQSFDVREFDIINGKPLLFKANRKIVAYIVNSLKGFRFKTGKPSDTSCLSWDFETFNEAIVHASEYMENRKQLLNY